MTRYVISAEGCDDSTRVLVELDDTEVAIVRRVADALNARSTYGCQPVVRIKTEADASTYEIESATEPIEED